MRGHPTQVPPGIKEGETFEVSGGKAAPRRGRPPGKQKQPKPPTHGAVVDIRHPEALRQLRHRLVGVAGSSAGGGDGAAAAKTTEVYTML